MTYAIIGFGNVGKALARAFARKSIAVAVPSSRDPQSIAATAKAIGPTITPMTLAEALKADILFLAVRCEQHADVAKTLPTWQGKTFVDMTNAYGVPPEDLSDQPSSAVIAQALSGAKLVKGFNHLLAGTLEQDPAIHGGRRVVFLASDDDAATAKVAKLAEDLGLAPVKLGGLSEGGLLVQARGNSWGPLIFEDLTKVD